MAKKVFVYTFDFTLDNYGQVLQYLATQIFLDSLGMETSLLKFNPALVRVSLYERVRGKLSRLLHPQAAEPARKPSELDLFFEKAARITREKETVHPRNFESFRQKYFRRTEYGRLDRGFPISEVLCVGSDQTWSFLSDVNFLDFGSDSTRRISLAPSFGAYVPKTQAEWASLEKKLSRFDFVSVREAGGLDICRNAGRADAVLAPDPTLLLNAEDYAPYEDNSEIPDEDYLFLYLLGNPIDVDVEEIGRFARQRGLKLVYVSSQGREDDMEETYATVPQWLALMRHAKYVVTNSFHGTALAIVYERPFLTIPLSAPFERMNDRVFSLLRTYGLANHIYGHEGLDAVLDTIDYTLVAKKRNEEEERLRDQIQHLIPFFE